MIVYTATKQQFVDDVHLRQKARPAFKGIFNLSQKNKNLRKQRDMLLPKLISEKIEV